MSVLTAAAIMEGVLDVLVKHYKSTGRDSRGKTCKRDSRSSRKAALKCSRGVRLDIQEVLQISDVSPVQLHANYFGPHSDVRDRKSLLRARSGSGRLWSPSKPRPNTSDNSESPCRPPSVSC